MLDSLDAETPPGRVVHASRWLAQSLTALGLQECELTWTALVQEDTASWARPANTRDSTQRYSLDRHSSICCTGGYQLAYAAGELSFCKVDNRSVLLSAALFSSLHDSLSLAHIQGHGIIKDNGRGDLHQSIRPV